MESPSPTAATRRGIENPTFRGERCRRILRGRGNRKAIIAVGRSILVVV